MPIGFGSVSGSSSFGRRGAPAIIASNLFAFTSFTFLPIVSLGSTTGPTLGQMQSAYAGTTWISSYFGLGSFQGYQRWTVPKTGSYTIEATGAAGGAGSGSSWTQRYGAKIIGTFSLTSGDILEMVIGVGGGNNGGAHGNENGGGGGTFITNITTSTILAVAGGSGGSASSIYSSCTQYPSIQQGQSTTSGGVPSECASWGGYSLGTPSVGLGGYGAGSYYGGAGGGYNSSGQNGQTHCAQAYGGGYYGNGLVGGTGNSCYTSNNTGGFGGGGGGQLGGPGGGGGYTGGSVAGVWASYAHGGGGGSYNGGTSQTNTAGGHNSTMGYCTITQL